MNISFVDPCAPNPCKNSGVCSRDGKGGFNCDCSSTGFNGTTCNIGNIICGNFDNNDFSELTFLN